MILREPKKLSLEEQVQKADRLRVLQNNETFRQLLLDAADACAREWANAQTAEAGEAARQRLQGIRTLEKQIQVDCDAGLRAARELEKQKPA